MKIFLTLIAPLLATLSLHAGDLKLAAVFSDHMVLQRDQPVPVWGWADAGENITVAFAGQSKSVRADATGKWQIKLDPMTASAESRPLTVQSAAPDRKLGVEDVLVGEVWLGSGQSNMAMRVSEVQHYPKEQATAELPLIRTFNEESKTSAKPKADASGRWVVCSPETVGTFSATLFFFGRELQRELNVPVGLINASVGGTPIESWIEARVQPPQWKRSAISPPETPAVPAPPAAPGAGNKDRRAAAAGPRIGPGGLFNGKIAPLIPYALRGVLWYQGEANTQPGRARFIRINWRCSSTIGANAGAGTCPSRGCSFPISTAPAKAGPWCARRCSKP